MHAILDFIQTISVSNALNIPRIRLQYMNTLVGMSSLWYFGLGKIEYLVDIDNLERNEPRMGPKVLNWYGKSGLQPIIGIIIACWVIFPFLSGAILFAKDVFISENSLTHLGNNIFATFEA